MSKLEDSGGGGRLRRAWSVGIGKLQDLRLLLSRSLFGLMRFLNAAQRIADARYVIFSCAMCAPFLFISWFCPAAIAAYRAYAVAYVIIFVLTLAILLLRVLGLITDMFSVDDGELIKCLKRNRKIRRSLDLCEKNLPAIKTQSPDKRSEEFEMLVREASLDVCKQARCTHPIRIPLAMHMVFAHLGLVALTFASADLVLQCSTTATQILECRHEMPETFLEKLLLYSTVSLDHMSLGNLRSFALPWQAEFLLLAEVVAGLYIMLVLAPLVFTEAAAFRAILEDDIRIQQELKNYWSIKFGISS